MALGEVAGVFLGAIALGFVHGIEPGHGWPVAASYALDQSNKWLYGFAASLLIGVGHLVSSLAMVGAFFYAKRYFDLAAVDEPVRIVGDIAIGGPISIVAGLLLVVLGIREYFHGHSHGHGSDGHSHGHGSDGHSHGHGEDGGHGDHSHTTETAHDNGVESDHAASNDGSVTGSGLRDKLATLLPFGGTHSHAHDDDLEDAADRGLVGIAGFAFLLGFAHEEEFEIIALCAGSTFCLELMSVYAITVVVAIVGLTMLLIAGYHRHREAVERYTPYLPAFSAAVLITMGVGFVLGLF